MTATEVSQILVSELGSDFRSRSIAGVSLADHIVEPEELTVTEMFVEGVTRQMWVVLRLELHLEENMFIAYEPSGKIFALCEFGPDKFPYVLGYHPNFLSALKAM